MRARTNVSHDGLSVVSALSDSSRGEESVGFVCGEEPVALETATRSQLEAKANAATPRRVMTSGTIGLRIESCMSGKMTRQSNQGGSHFRKGL